jgi:hypothetical protein
VKEGYEVLAGMDRREMKKEVNEGYGMLTGLYRKEMN